jgi:iron-sulfur cluster repair protein YtfE (RIC family)
LSFVQRKNYKACFVVLVVTFIEQLKKEHVIFRSLLEKIDKIRGAESFDVSEARSEFMKLYSLWDIHEKKEEANFSKVSVVDISRFFEKVLEDHRALRPYKENIHEALLSDNHEEIKETLYRNFDWLRDALLEHFTYEESYLFTKLEPFSEEELGFVLS